MQVEALALMIRNKIASCHFPSTISDFARLMLASNEDEAPHEFMSMDIAMRRLLLDLDVALDSWAADQIMQARNLRSGLPD